MKPSFFAVIASPEEGNRRVASNSFRMAPNFSMEELRSPQWGLCFQPE